MFQLKNGNQKTNNRMKKVFISTLFTLFIAWSALGQVDTTKFRDPANYHLAIDYYKTSWCKNSLSLHLNYQLACYNSLLQNNDSAFHYLNKSIELGARPEDIITDTDFNSLHSDKRWDAIINFLKSKYLSSYKKITNPELSVDLWLLGIEDQRYRTLLKNYKLNERVMETPDMWEKRINYIKRIVKESGWPTISAVGEKSAESVFLIIQHANLDDIKEILPLIIETTNRGEVKWSNAAMMIDRYLSMTEGVQIYGTQFCNNGKMNKETGKIEWGKLSFYPIADEENINLRRKSIGLKPFEEYCKEFNIVYEKPNERNEYKNIPIKKNWIKKGFIFTTSN